MYYMNFRWIINPLNASVGLIIPPLPPPPTPPRRILILNMISNTQKVADLFTFNKEIRRG